MAALSDEDVRLWVRDGFLIKRGLLDPALCAAARERLWALNSLPRLRRDAPASWTEFRTDEESDDPASLRRRYSWRARSCKQEELLLELLPRNRAVFSVAEELLGTGAVGFTPSGYYSEDLAGGFSEAKTRGIYAIMPYDRQRPRTPLRLHNDSTLENRDRVSVVGYIDDVAPGGGGFAVWPGTHASCWNKIDHWEERRRHGQSWVVKSFP
jgi:hypothetical protein